MTFLQASQARLSEDDRNVIDRFLTLDLWCRREVCVFLFSADHETSLNRESSFKLIESHGSVMNPDVIGKLNDAYTLAADRQCSRFTIVRVDTSFMNGETPSFQRIAFVVAERILDMMHTLLDQRLLVTEPLGFEGLTDSPEETEAVLGRILNDGNPRFMERSAAEASGTYVQVVPYAYLKDAAGRYFIARRRADHPRTELRGTYTMLAGGHAEQKDWDSSDPAGVFERCLRRELDEELIGLEIRSVRRVGVINDSRSSVGTHHLAILFEVEVGGAPKVRRQATDQEFGREAVSWKTGEEIGRFVADLDPWSQLVAAREFKLPVPELPNEPTLFTRGMQK
jgi:predicted NUDIX family phosphoesterase